MQLSRAVLAMLMAIPFTAATAGVTVSPLILGYTWYPDNAKKRERTEQFNVNQASTGY